MVVFQAVLSVVLGSLDPPLLLPVEIVAVVVSGDAVPTPVEGEVVPVVSVASFGTELKFHWVMVAAGSGMAVINKRGKIFIIS